MRALSAGFGSPRGLALALILACLAGCSRGHGTNLAPAAQARPMLLSAPGDARVVVRVAPRELLAEPSARALWEAFIDPERERKFSERTGIDPRQLFELLFVELSRPEGAFMLVLRGPFDAEAAVREAGERLAYVEVSADRPRIRREGLRGEGRWAYVALAPDTLLMAEDVPPHVLAAQMARLTGAAVGLPPEARALAQSYADEHLVVLVPTPLDLPGQSGAALLLARQRALAFALRPEAGAYALELELRGEFPETAEDNFGQLITSVARTQLGQDLGLSTALPSLSVQHRSDAGQVQLGLRVPADGLVSGLRMLFTDELDGLFQ